MRAKNPHAVALGRAGGLASARKRAEPAYAPTRRRVAQIAANARWAKWRAAKQQR